MVWGDHIRTAAAAALVALSLAGLTACAGSSSPSAGGGAALTLAQTKSPVQLLRNEAASRIDEFVVETVNETEDLSTACKTEEADPLGLSRSWTSSVEVSLKEGSAWRTSIVADELVASFEEQGWVASRGAPSAVVRHSYLPALLREGLPGSALSGGNEVFDVRTRLLAGIRFVE